MPTPSTKLSRIRHLRNRAGWTRIQLAVYAKMAVSTLDKLEAAELVGDVEVLERARPSTYRKIARALCVNVNEVCPWLAR